MLLHQGLQVVLTAVNWYALAAEAAQLLVIQLASQASALPVSEVASLSSRRYACCPAPHVQLALHCSALVAMPTICAQALVLNNKPVDITDCVNGQLKA